MLNKIPNICKIIQLSAFSHKILIRESEKRENKITNILVYSVDSRKLKVKVKDLTQIAEVVTKLKTLLVCPKCCVRRNIS